MFSKKLYSIGKLLRVEKARRNRPHDPTPGEYKGPTGKMKHKFLL
jgi:hypothetical protein